METLNKVESKPKSKPIDADKLGLSSEDENLDDLPPPEDGDDTFFEGGSDGKPLPFKGGDDTSSDDELAKTNVNLPSKGEGASVPRSTDKKPSIILKTTVVRSAGSENPLIALLTEAFDRTYYSTELLVQQKFAKKRNRKLQDPGRLIHKTAKNRILQFLGLPSGDSEGTRKILKSLAGWNEEYSTSRNLLQAIIIFPVNLLLTASKLSLNIVKLATEFLPHILAKGSLRLFNAYKNWHDKSNFYTLSEMLAQEWQSLVIGLFIKGGVGLGFLLLGAITAAFHLVYFIGGATTSPAENLRAAFNAGDDLAGHGKSGKVFGVIFALGSILTTACVYAILFPLAINLLVTQAPAVLPAVADFITKFVATFSAQAGASVATFLYTTAPTALAAFGAMINSAIPFIPFIALVVGLATASAIGVGGITPVVAVIDQAKENKDGGAYCERLGLKNNEEAIKVLLVDGDERYSNYYPPLLIQAKSTVVKTVKEAFDSVPSPVETLKKAFDSTPSLVETVKKAFSPSPTPVSKR